MTVGLKVFSTSNKKEFTLRNVQANDFNDPTSLKTELFNQLGGEIIYGMLNFDIGYLVHNEKKWIHNAKDASDALALVANGGKLTFGVLELVKRARPRDKNEHTQVRDQAVRNPQK